jgi:hypothetical protein
MEVVNRFKLREDELYEDLQTDKQPLESLLQLSNNTKFGQK